MSDIVEVPVLQTDIQAIREAVNAAYHMCYTQDIADNYRKLNNRGSFSALTKALESSLTKLDAYLQEPDDVSAE